MKYLTSGDIAEIIKPIGVTDRQFSGWCARGVITADGGGSRGNHHRWSLMQALGIAVAAKVFMTTRGCVSSYVGMVVEAFGKRTGEWLQQEFDEGRTHLMGVVGSGPDPIPVLHVVMSEPLADFVDVQQTLAEVQEAVLMMSGEKPNRPGRVRGLKSGA